MDLQGFLVLFLAMDENRFCCISLLRECLHLTPLALPCDPSQISIFALLRVAVRGLSTARVLARRLLLVRRSIATAGLHLLECFFLQFF